MPNPHAFVEGIKSLSPSREVLRAKPPHEPRIVSVTFESNRTGLLDLKSPLAAVWADVLEHLRQQNRPAYVEIDPETKVITEVLVPQAARVWSIKLQPQGDVDVVFYTSAARHYLRWTHPDFQQMLNALQTAKDSDTTVLVTASRPDQEIVDVRPLPKPFGSESPSAPAPPPAPDPPVSPQRAQELFDLMNARSCDPCAATAPCIPFKYPTDGCFARAHEMVRLMQLEGEQPEKVWIFGSLVAGTSNDPDCHVDWGWHVAPTLMVTTSGSLEKRVIDPSLSDHPITPEAWKTLQGDPNATLAFTGWEQYFPDGTIDNSFSETQSDLVNYRDALNAQCAIFGSPPYTCPIVKNCFFIVDRSTFSQGEIDAMLQQASPAEIDAAFYVVLDGYSPAELLITSAALSGVPNVKPTLAMNPPVAEMTVEAVHLDVEDPVHLNRRQRLTWKYRITFTGTSGFVGEVQAVTLSASIKNLSSSAILYLIKQPNPYEIDGTIAWLSTDLRVFQIKAGESKFGVAVGNNPSAFITQVIGNLNFGSTGGQTFENSISTDQQTARLELSETVGGTRVYNFAVARVRYRSQATTAQNVRVFFRLFPASSTSLEYSQATTYRCGGQSGTIVPLLGVQGINLVTIPCFAAPRVDSSTSALTAQTDPANVQSIPPDAAGQEVVRYYGCWLDFNQTQAQFPVQPVPLDGPFSAASRKSIQELIRNQHQCLVSEIMFDPAPIPAGTSPSLSDKLAQRNLAIVDSANPGDIDSHRIPHTFEIRPTPLEFAAERVFDELMLDWGNTPVGSLATLFLPRVDANDILRLAAEMYRWHTLTRIDEHSLQCRTGGITFIPIPPGDGANHAGMMTIDLPPTVRKGQVFTIVVRQVTSAATGHRVGNEMVARERASAAASTSAPRGRHILGTFQLTIPVREKEEMLGTEERLLSNLRWIQRAIPKDDRWSAVFGRYVTQVAHRVDALGGDSSRVMASPSDSQVERAKRCATFGAMTAVLLAAGVVSLGALTGAALTTIGVPILILFAGVGLYWMSSCQPRPCNILRAIVAGAGGGAVTLALLLPLSLFTPQLAAVLIVSVGVTVAAVLAGRLGHCF